MSILAVSLSNSPARCGRLPGPDEAKFNFPGCALASGISSFMSRAGTLPATTSISRTVVACGLSLRHGLGSEYAALPAAIVDQHRLLNQFRHALGDHARDDVV